MADSDAGDRQWQASEYAKAKTREYPTMSDAPRLRISITPEPNDTEKAAIAAAVVATLPKVQEDESSSPVNKWGEAGKREALREHIWEKRS